MGMDNQNHRVFAENAWLCVLVGIIHNHFHIRLFGAAAFFAVLFRAAFLRAGLPYSCLRYAALLCPALSLDRLDIDVWVDR